MFITLKNYFDDGSWEGHYVTFDLNRLIIAKLDLSASKELVALHLEGSDGTPYVNHQELQDVLNSREA